jgi:tetratricopeptide (TPR) repeat protein
MLNFAPLMGSELFDICIEKKYIPNNKESKMMSDFRHPIVDTEDFTPGYIKDKSYEINLYLNFIHNSDFMVGDYKTALKGFLNVIRAKSTHALAHYYIYKCYQNLGEQDIANNHLNECKNILKNDTFWKDVFEKYNITI